MDEDYDELMGPRPGQSMRFQDNPAPLPNASVRRNTSQTRSGPPSALFQSMPDRWAEREAKNEAEARQATARKTASDIMGFDEEEEAMGTPTGATTSSPLGIRQEALRMLEVAESGTYSVHRTVTGGFMAEPRSLGSNKRVPTALAGLGSFSTPAARSSKPRVPASLYRDEPTGSYSQEDYEYGNYDDSRFADQQVNEEKKESSSTWSSRYSVNDTLLSMSGGSIKSPPSTKKSSSSSFMDRLDASERRASRNMFDKGPTKNSKVFGAGFNFRQKHVFGKQGATSPESNLRSVWMDAGASNSPARSWMDDLKEKRTRRRNYMIIATLFVAFVVTLVAVMTTRDKSSDVAPLTGQTSPEGEEAVTFYITSDIPFSGQEEQLLSQHVKSLNTHGEFLVHLGNIQDITRTGCSKFQYENVADILMESSVPVFVLPGQEDWSNCPDQDSAWLNWSENFLKFDDYFHKEHQLENFAFKRRDVLFVGVHEVNGRIEDHEELHERNKANVEWIDGIINTYMDDDTRALVVFANGRPLIQENNDFYMGMASVFYKVDIPVAYIHANDGDGEGTVTYKPFNMEGMDHVTAIQASRGGTSAPMRIHVGWDETDPFIVG